jgi:hypothetical protein
VKTAVPTLFIRPPFLHFLHLLVQFDLFAGALVALVVEPVALVVAQDRPPLIDRGRRLDRMGLAYQ